MPNSSLTAAWWHEALRVTLPQVCPSKATRIFGWKSKRTPFAIGWTTCSKIRATRCRTWPLICATEPPSCPWSRCCRRGGCARTPVRSISTKCSKTPPMPSTPSSRTESNSSTSVCRKPLTKFHISLAEISAKKKSSDRFLPKTWNGATFVGNQMIFFFLFKNLKKETLVPDAMCTICVPNTDKQNDLRKRPKKIIDRIGSTFTSSWFVLICRWDASCCPISTTHSQHVRNFFKKKTKKQNISQMNDEK